MRMKIRTLLEKHANRAKGDNRAWKEMVTYALGKPNTKKPRRCVPRSAKIKPAPKPTQSDSAISPVNFAVTPAVCDKPEAGVYIVGSTKHNWYKIGQSQTVTIRMASYRSMPFTIDIARVFLCHHERCRAIEIVLHKSVRNRRIRANDAYSEWYHLTPDELADLLALAASESTR
jgi:hypothetical protein